MNFNPNSYEFKSLHCELSRNVRQELLLIEQQLLASLAKMTRLLVVLWALWWENSARISVSQLLLLLQEGKAASGTATNIHWLLDSAEALAVQLCDQHTLQGRELKEGQKPVTSGKNKARIKQKLSR